MQVKEKNIEHQIQLWAIAGPFVTLLTLLVSMMKVTEMQSAFSICLIAGVISCWKWKLKGLAISMGFLLAVVSYHSVNLDFSNILWTVGLGASASLSFLVTALSFDEVAALTSSMQVESKSRLDNLLKLDEKIKNEAYSHQKNFENLQVTIKELEEEVFKYKERSASNEKLAQVVREELASTHSRNDELQQEVFDWRHKYNSKENELNAAREEIRQKENTVDSAELDLAYQEISTLEKEVKHLNDQLKTIQSQLDYCDEERQAHEQTLAKLDVDYSSLEGELEDTRLLLETRDEEVIKLKDQIEEQRSFQGEVEKYQETIDQLNVQVSNLELSIKELEQELVVEKQKVEQERSSAAEKELVLQEMINEANKERDAILAKQEKASKKESSELRKAKGKLTQLQKQFKEKSEVLDETRRAIFHMQEKLLTAQRELDEAKKSDRSDSDQILEQTIAKMEEDRKVAEENHQQEIDDLHEIIASLSAK